MTAETLHPNPEIAAALARIYRLHRTSIDMRLARSPYLTLLDRLGNPECKLPPVIHVAGTNGKGSTIAFLRAIYEAAGYRVHAYTSPHLFTFNERIRLNGSLLTDNALMGLIGRVEAAAKDLPDTVTFFEFTTALAFLAMSEAPADICLLETGMGGRLDCTNVVPDKALTIITKISYDHTEFLGEALPEIAGEKAGIMQAGTPCVIAPQFLPELAMPVLRERARVLGCPLSVYGSDWNIQADADGFSVSGQRYPLPNLAGRHQIDNAATALVAVDVLNGRFKVSQDAKRTGLATVSWPGRLTLLTAPATAADDVEIWYDGGHNDSGAAALAAQCAAWRDEGKTVHVIAAYGEDKDGEAFLSAFLPYAASLTLMDLPVGRKPQDAVKAASKLSAALRRTLRLAHTPEEALQGLPYTGRDIVLYCGSLYLAELVMERPPA